MTTGDTMVATLEARMFVKVSNPARGDAPPLFVLRESRDVFASLFAGGKEGGHDDLKRDD